MDWFYTVVGIIGALGLLAFMFKMPYLLDNIHLAREAADIRPYKEYETPSIIARDWHNSKFNGVCGKCGMDDCPILVNRYDSWSFYIGPPKCKWCAELDNINRHLATHGVRRLKKV